MALALWILSTREELYLQFPYIRAEYPWGNKKDLRKLFKFNVALGVYSHFTGISMKCNANMENLHSQETCSCNYTEF